MFKPVPSKVDFPAMECNILRFWDETQAFKKLVAKNQGKPRWSFIDGPITANNPMGVHHVWGRTYKDLWQRFKAMRGFSTRYQNGFDGQGLWIEVEVEKELGFKSKLDIETYGIDRFVEKCKERVSKFSGIQTQQSIRLGYWMDWEHSYYTVSDENNYTIWLFLKRCHERGWIYKGHDVMPWCPRCSTGLSDMEIATEGYEEIVHPGVYLKFPLVGGPRESLLVWTTTPWTLTSNVSAAVHPFLTYVKVKQGDEFLCLAKAALPALSGEYKVVDEFTGQKLEGMIYQGPFDELPAQKGVEHRVILWKDVSETEGTGIVHIAPGCGKEDFQLSKEHNLAVIAPLDEFGVFVDGFDWLTGKGVGEVAKPIIEDLKKKGLLYKVEDYRHRYPVCWRCHTELVFRLVDEWFISMDELRHLIMEVAKQIRWIPEFGLERELDWLRNMSDWMISKKRYWGLALPIYQCSHGHFEVIGSEVELEERAVEGWDQFEGHSPHRPWIDAVKIRLEECGEVASRIPDVGNPWLDAGIVPFSTLNYRHDRGYWEKWFPADFITESFPGQYRNWFYALLVMSTVLENRPPFLTVLGHASVRDEKGEEMHKSKGNLILLDEAAEKAGVDIMRWMYATQIPENNLNFGYRVADEVRRRFHIPLWNVYSFFVTYARIDGWTSEKGKTQRQRLSDLDRWILSRLYFGLKEVTVSLEDYDPATASRHIQEFVEDLSNWYVRRSRRRFWKSEQDEDKNAAYATLYECLVTLAKILAPFTPYLAEEMYQNLVRSVDPQAAESVHHTDWPQVKEELIDESLMDDLRLVMKVASLGHAARSKAGIKVRQPLAEVVVAIPFIPTAGAGPSSQDVEESLQKMSDQLLEELNVKRIAVRIKEEFMPFLEEEQAGNDYAFVEEENYVVGVKTTLTPDLVHEGLAREIVRRIQNLRKEADFNIDDKILTYYESGIKLRQVINQEGEYIRRETLSEKLIEDKPPAGSIVEEYQIDGERLTLGLVRRGG